MTPVVSVVVVCFNQQDTIGRTLDSILAQEVDFPYEIVVNDDASSDGTADVVRRYADKYPDIISLHVNPQNRGVQANYFDAVSRCRADLIADCAGDDFWCDPHKLARQYRLMSEHPEVSLVHTGWQYSLPDGSVKATSWNPLVSQPFKPGRNLLPLLATHTGQPMVHLCTALYRRQPVMDVLASDPQFLLNPDYGCEDLQIICLEAAAGDIAYLRDVTLCYSVGHDSISAAPSNPLKEFRFYFGSLLLHLRIFEKFCFAGNSSVAPLIKGYMHRALGYLTGLAATGRSADCARRLLSIVREKHLPLSCKHRLRLYLTLLRYGRG